MSWFAIEYPKWARISVFIGIPEMAPKKSTVGNGKGVFFVVASPLFFFVVFAAEWICTMGEMGGKAIY